jgi:hypothetical protein
MLADGGFVMRNTVEIDHRHSRAIAQEIGERLRASVVEDELPPNLRILLERLRELDRFGPLGKSEGARQAAMAR